jgi:hypothetical protein
LWLECANVFTLFDDVEEVARAAATWPAVTEELKSMMKFEPPRTAGGEKKTIRKGNGVPPRGGALHTG